jgi:hypothetical protein
VTWYHGGMSYLPEMDGVKILTPRVGGAVDSEPLSPHSVAMLERRENFARAYIARGRTLGNGQKLDPVLASHLGLQEPTK